MFDVMDKRLHEAREKKGTMPITEGDRRTNVHYWLSEADSAQQGHPEGVAVRVFRACNVDIVDITVSKTTGRTQEI